ncbi:hypothetical protein [Pseudonocardia sp. NPDC049154]|uniref:hypothetical protein n=1 Tax=Pseudonocardia sp. NPDC049154 TaxID=3155501 RepID=UPI0033DDE140
MTTTQPERQACGAGVLPDEVVRGEVAEDPTIAIPVVPRQYVPVPPPHPRPIADPYGPPAGLDDGYYGYGGFSSGSVCSGDGGYSDIHAGTGVTIANAAGAVIATGSLSSGRASSSTTCDFTFTVPDVPAGEDFYQVEVSHRGTLTYTADELRAGLGLSLGD